MQAVLLCLLILPVLGALACALVRSARLARWLAMGSSLLCTLAGAILLFRFDYSNPDVQFQCSLGQIQGIFFDATIGLDVFSLWLLVLTVFLHPLAIAASFHSIRQHERQYYAWMLLLLPAMLGVFLARDALLFYVFFEASLVPMFFIIGIWGGPERRYAAAKFFLFTFAASVFTLASIIYLGINARDFAIDRLLSEAQVRLSPAALRWVVLGLLVGFAVKVPLVPLHTWLPLAHTEAPTAGSVILAGVLLKLGGYGVLRFLLPIGLFHPGSSQPPLPWLLHLLAIISVIGIIYGALAAWVQQDIKKLVAYSSVSHMGFCVLGLAALNPEGLQGSLLHMLNHGISTGALFLVVGMIYDRYRTRHIQQLSGLAGRMPILAFFFILFTLSSMGLPGLNGFVSEFLTTLGAFKSPLLGLPYGVLAAAGVVLGAVYMLHMAACVIWGPLKVPASQGDAPLRAQHSQADCHPLPADLNAREIAILAPLALSVVLLGVAPRLVLSTLQAPTAVLLDNRPDQQGPPEDMLRIQNPMAHSIAVQR